MNGERIVRLHPDDFEVRCAQSRFEGFTKLSVLQTKRSIETNLLLMLRNQGLVSSIPEHGALSFARRQEGGSIGELSVTNTNIMLISGMGSSFHSLIFEDPAWKLRLWSLDVVPPTTRIFV